jgi:hypothetical protein
MFSTNRLVHHGRALFPGANNEDELMLIFKQMGTPTPFSWPDVVKMPEYRRDWPMYRAKVGGKHGAMEHDGQRACLKVV